MNGGIQDFVRDMVAKYPMGGMVLEVGSLDICGNPRRWFREHCPSGDGETRFPLYIGVDRTAGNNVDMVMNSHHLEFLDSYFDVVISIAAMEHDEKFWVSAQEMARVLKPGGWMIWSVPGWRGCGPHMEEDYWRFMDKGVKVLMEQVGLEVLELIDNPNENDIYALGRNK